MKTATLAENVIKYGTPCTSAKEVTVSIDEEAFYLLNSIAASFTGAEEKDCTVEMLINYAVNEFLEKHDEQIRTLE